jgi:glycosyltransferase involved in cell wall biosynthesis
MAMNVLVVAEYYPRAHDPVMGVWAHRQALAARDAGAEVRILVLHRPVPPIASVKNRDLTALREAIRQPSRAVLDGIEVEYLRYLSPPRPVSYGAWGAWAAPALALAIRRVRRGFAFDLIHAHYAIPAGDAVRRAAPGVPLAVSVHGGDVHGVERRRIGARAVRNTLAHARLTIANSAGTARRCEQLGARATRVVHLGAELPLARSENRGGPPTLVTVGHLVARKRHADVISALAVLRDRHPDLRYVIVGDGPERERLLDHSRSLGVGSQVQLHGQLPPAQAAAEARAATLFVMPSVDEAFGVAYVEAMAGGVPAIGCRGEDGPEEIARIGGGILLVGTGDVDELARQLDSLLSDQAARAELGREARATVEREFTWARCGEQTLEAYRYATKRV